MSRCGFVRKNGKKCRRKTHGGFCNLHSQLESSSPFSSPEDILDLSPRIYSPTKMAFLGLTPPASPRGNSGSPTYAMPDYTHQKDRKLRTNTGFTPPSGDLDGYAVKSPGKSSSYGGYPGAYH